MNDVLKRMVNNSRLAVLVVMLVAMATMAFKPTPSNAALLPILNWTQRSDWINVKTSYGATGNGSTDDTAAIQAALTAATSGDTIYFPAGTYKITSTLNLTCSTAKFGVNLIGHGRNTVISWYGPANNDMLIINSNPYGRYTGIIFDGRGIARYGTNHYNTNWFETSIRYKHMGFYNLNVGIGAETLGGLATAETSLENCIFDHCTTGLYVQGYNEYDWTVSGCDFIGGHWGIFVAYGNAYIRDCYFQGNVEGDIFYAPEHGCSIRRCKSVGSYYFLNATGFSPSQVQDCYISGWTGPEGAMKMRGTAPLTLSFTRFVNPPDALPPVRFDSPNPIIDCGNIKPAAAPSVYSLAGSTVYSVPVGVYPSKVGSTNGANVTTFVRQTVTVPPTVYDAKVNFGAVGDGITDDTVAIQNTINAAKLAGMGAIAYVPKGNYKITSTLNVSGSSYVFGGSGYNTRLVWAGAANGTMVSVANPYNVTMENMLVGHMENGWQNNAIDIEQTATSGTSKMTYDGIYVYGKGQNAPGVKGIRFNNLNGNCTVVLNMVEGNLRCLNSANATIVGNVTYEGVISVDHSSSTRTGFLGFQTRLSTGNTYGMIVTGNNNVTLSDWYQEQNSGGINLSGASGNPAGRITITGGNTDTATGVIATINNYSGKVFLGPNQIYPPYAYSINQTGTLPLDIVMFCNAFYSTSLSNSLSSATFRSVGNWKVMGTGTPPADSYTAATLTSMTKAFDDLQRLGTLDLSLNYSFVPV